ILVLIRARCRRLGLHHRLVAKRARNVAPSPTSPGHATTGTGGGPTPSGGSPAAAAAHRSPGPGGSPAAAAAHGHGSRSSRPAGHFPPSSFCISGGSWLG